MTPRVALPDGFDAEPFAVSSGLGGGLSQKRMRGRDLERPLRGVRVSELPDTRVAYLRAAATRLKPWQALAGSAAAALWGLPLPTRLGFPDAVVVVAAPMQRTVPTARAFRGLRVSPDRLRTVDLDGLALTDPLATWATCARELSLVELIAMGDALVTPSKRYPRRHPELPVFAVDDLRRVCDEWEASPGIRAMRLAVERVRVGVDSPMETELRLALVDAGIDEPVIHHPVRLRSGDVIEPDLALPDLRIAFEYEGDEHRERRRFRGDITRHGSIEDVGWVVSRSTVEDLRPSSLAYTDRVKRLIWRRRRLLAA